MGRQDIKSLRRSELISAAISAIHTHGFADLTVGQIAKDAETSTGSIHYYFGGKEALLEATMRHLLSVLRRAVLRRLGAAQSARDRLAAIVLGNFDETLYTVETCTVWTQFWAYAPYSTRLARLQRVNKHRVRSNLRHELSQLLAPTSVETARLAIQCYMDGVWIHATQTGTQTTPQQVQHDAANFLELLVPSSQPVKV